MSKLLSKTSFKSLLSLESPLQLIGVINPLIALLAQEAGFRALYLSGAGVATADLGLPDLGLSSLDDVLLQIRRITSRVNLPLIVDADTGWGSPLNVYRTFYEMSKAGASGAHIEDQNLEKRCGHRDGKKLVSIEMMQARIRAALDGRRDDDFVVIARTDALAVEGLPQALERAIKYEEAGADIIFVEAASDFEIYKQFSEHLSIPILANMTEFGKTPLATLPELKDCGVDVVLYPLSVYRAMNYAASHVLHGIREKGSQAPFLAMMQTRESLYQTLHYQNYESELDHYLMENTHDI